MTRPLRAAVQVAFCGFWSLASLCAQNGAIDRARSELLAAKARAESGDPEGAAQIVARARAILAGLPTELSAAAAEVAAEIDGFARRNDTRDAARARARAKAARQFAALAQRYLDLRWFELAEPMVRDVARIDAGVGAEAQAALRIARSDSVDGTPRAGDNTMAGVFLDGEHIWGSDDWRFEGDDLLSPEYDQAKFMRISAERFDFGAPQWAVGVEIGVDEPRDAWLVFGYRHIHEYAALHVMLGTQGTAELELVHVRDGQDKVLATQKITLPPADRELKSLRVSLRKESGEWSARLSGNPEFATTVPADFHGSGFLGLMVVGTRSLQPRCRFRALTLDGLR